MKFPKRILPLLVLILLFLSGFTESLYLKRVEVKPEVRGSSWSWSPTGPGFVVYIDSRYYYASEVRLGFISVSCNETDRNLVNAITLPSWRWVAAWEDGNTLFYPPTDSFPFFVSERLPPYHWDIGYYRQIFLREAGQGSVIEIRVRLSDEEWEGEHGQRIFQMLSTLEPIPPPIEWGVIFTLTTITIFSTLGIIVWLKTPHSEGGYSYRTKMRMKDL
ncbi:MAG: hypothetical protein FWD97_00230 [Defluviitaleaceae bacterium]|nr:hypothetical protein [Defluviitaleaceae bacterium]